MPKSPRYWTRLILTFISRFKLIFFVGIGIGIIVFIFFELLFPNLPKGTTKIGIVGEYTPDNLPISISRSISVGLTNLDKTGSPIIGVSDKWEASDSGKVWTFHLNDNLHWQDGSDLTSKDIKYNFSDAAMSTPDKYTVIFKLKTPLSTFPAIVSKPIFKKGLLGLGEWRVTGLTLAGSYIETLTIQDKDNNQRIYKFYPTEDRARLAYELGGIDELTDLMDSKPFSSWNVANVTKNVNTQRYVAIFFNTTDGLTGDKDFRQALNYAIDKNQFGQKRAFGPISPASWAYNPSLKPYDQDIPHAKELITEAKIDPATRKDLKIKLTTTPDLLSQAEIIAKDWER
jgi:peptide/nickel transport system substrate-binding protein